jgi:hypothetical protein
LSTLLRIPPEYYKEVKITIENKIQCNKDRQRRPYIYKKILRLNIKRFPLLILIEISLVNWLSAKEIKDKSMIGQILPQVKFLKAEWETPDKGHFLQIRVPETLQLSPVNKKSNLFYRIKKVELDQIFQKILHN